MITNETKQQIISNLQNVPVDTIWGAGISLFIDQVEIKSDADFKKIVSDIKSAMEDGPENMKVVMGPSYDYFKSLLV